MNIKILQEALELVESLSHWELTSEGDFEPDSDDYVYNTFIDLDEKIKKARDIIATIKQTESSL